MKMSYHKYYYFQAIKHGYDDPLWNEWNEIK